MSIEIFEKLQKSFGHILYKDINHTYTDTRNGNNLISVTTRLKDYTSKFDETYWSGFKAMQERVSQEDKLKQWHIDRVYGTTKGSIVHNYLENRLQNKIFPVPNDPILYQPEIETLLSQAEEFVKQFFELGYLVIKNELIVGNNTTAGQMDLLSWNKGFIVQDYKTDKNIVYTNKYQQLENLPEQLHEELSDKKLIDDCNFNKYCLQINAYRQFLEKYAKIECKQEQYVIWFNHNNSKPVWIEIPVLESSVFADL